MQHGICLISLAALREEASHKSQMVTQLLFGDLFEIINKQDDWINIKMTYDGYEGWVASNQVKLISIESYNELLNQPAVISGDIIQVLSNITTGNSFLISAGSTMYGVNNDSFSILGEDYKYSGNLSIVDQSSKQAVNHALQFLNTPYLWGGRSSMGIDCSGLMQIAFKMAGIKLPRDAAQQINSGFPVDLINEAQPGDLCFFDNHEGIINHVGMILDEHHIIHAHGKVRIDLIDHNGIFSKEVNKYTHQLRVINRV
jgi:gamma-D-glutamyl-L-lysine dipeptidyl-peptidase